MNTNLDCHSEKGEVALADQRIAVDAVLRYLADERISAVHTPEASEVDAFFISCEDEIVFVTEVKTRYGLTLEKLRGQFSNLWLISADKLKAMQAVCSIVRVAGYGMLYLKDSELVLLIQLYDERGNTVISWNERETETQATINGGTKITWNAFIPMTTAEIIPV